MRMMRIRFRATMVLLVLAALVLTFAVATASASIPSLSSGMPAIPSALGGMSGFGSSLGNSLGSGLGAATPAGAATGLSSDMVQAEAAGITNDVQNNIASGKNYQGLHVALPRLGAIFPQSGFLSDMPRLAGDVPTSLDGMASPGSNMQIGLSP